MLPGDKLSTFLVTERNKIEQSCVEPGTKDLLKQLVEDFVRLLDSMQQ